VGTRTTRHTRGSPLWYRISIVTSFTASSESVFIRRARRFTSMLAQSTTVLWIPHTASARCSQNPSRPAS
jgi:hypothetical protein